MNPSIAALLELQLIDKKRQSQRNSSDNLRARLEEARKALAAAQAAAKVAQDENEKIQALIRQYEKDAQRCEQTITDLRNQQPTAKTNKDYMALINGIEQAKVEKSMREQSLKDLGGRIEGITQKAAAADAKVKESQAKIDDLTAKSGSGQVTPEEAAIQAEYDAKKAAVDPDWLKVYERLVKARHPSPLMKVDPKTRATPVGVVLSHNQLEQIRLGKLVIDRTTNAILYVVE